MHNLLELLTLPEQEFLDFKQCYHTNNAKLVHDVLCLSNAKTNSDRYLIFGVEDSTKNIIGIENDANRKPLSGIIDIIRNSNFNTLPTLKLETLNIDGHEIDVLCIYNNQKRPFFLLEDKTYQGTTVRAGVIYTRDGDCNTPLDRTANMAQLQEIWQEHFGLALTPLERFLIYIEDHENWEKESTLDDAWSYYYKLFPEFRIDVVAQDETGTRVFSETQECHLYNVTLCYLSVKLAYEIFFFGDGTRYFLPYPEYSSDLYSDVIGKMANEIDFFGEFFYLLSSNLNYRLYLLFQDLMRTNVPRDIEAWNRYAIGAKPFLVFDNIEEVKQRIREVCKDYIG